MLEHKFYCRMWQESFHQPAVGGPDDDLYQKLGRYVRAIACVSSRPFAVPVGLTAEVTGLAPETVGFYLGQLLHHDVLRIHRSGVPGRYTRYVFGPGGVRRRSSVSKTYQAC